MCACTFIYMYFWVYTGEINAKRIRERYLQSVLRQDIAYFDNVGAGEIATRIQTDTRTPITFRYNVFLTVSADLQQRTTTIVLTSIGLIKATSCTHVPFTRMLPSASSVEQQIRHAFSPAALPPGSITVSLSGRPLARSRKSSPILEKPAQNSVCTSPLSSPICKAELSHDTLTRENDIPVLEWPAFSPSLNPIKHIWQALKSILHREWPYIEAIPGGPEAIRTELQRVIPLAWNEVTLDILQGLTESMPDWVKAVIAAEGWYTHC